MKAKNIECLNVAEAARKLNVSERSVRNYCAQGRVGVREALLREMESGVHGGLYHWLQINFAYSSNHMEGSRLTEEETRYIFETRTIGAIKPEIPIDDIVEAANHFSCIDLVIRSAKATLNEAYVKRLHFQLKNGTTDSRKGWFMFASKGCIRFKTIRRLCLQTKRLRYPLSKILCGGDLRFWGGICIMSDIAKSERIRKNETL